MNMTFWEGVDLMVLLASIVAMVVLGWLWARNVLTDRQLGNGLAACLLVVAVSSAVGGHWVGAWILAVEAVVIYVVFHLRTRSR